MTQTSRERQLTTILAAAAFIIVLVTWQMAGLQVVLYPLRLFVSLVHELGHGLTAILTGGKFLQFVINENGSGVATTAGGNSLLILPMGYLGAALFGATLLVLTNRLRHTRAVPVGIAVFITGCVIAFSNTNTVLLLGLLGGATAAFLLGDHYQRFRLHLFIAGGLAAVLLVGLIWSSTGLKVGIGISVVLALFGVFAPKSVIIFVLNFLALTVGLNAITDILYVLNNMGAGVGTVRNDAAAMGALTSTPGQFWAVLWAFLAVAMVLTAAYIAFIQPLRKR